MTAPSATAGGVAVSVVVPFAGAQRLPNLTATLVALRQRPGVSEIVVVETSLRRDAEPLARRWADAYVFEEHAGPFERAHALNVGLDVAGGDLVLLHDADLLLPGDYVLAAAEELGDRGLDFLVPYATVRYLSEADSAAVRAGIRDPADCVPTHVLRSAVDPWCRGGSGLVRRDFVERHGGLVEGFRGWGGEDEAWMWKATVCGRAGITVHHLYHPWAAGPDHEALHAANVELLRRVRAVADPRRMAREFPRAQRPRGAVRRFEPRRALPADPSPSTLPVWTYWEGDCPEWIRACRRTIARHALEVRFLTPLGFDRLRDRDRDVDLSRLHAAHRADFIRAFLLARYGGLWIDADCVVLRSLAPVTELLRDHELVAHRERSGLASNGFLGARPGSAIARAFYERVRSAVRSGEPLGWTSLGSEPLSRLLDERPGAWHELPCARVQPVCWSTPEVLLERAPPERHEAARDREALCYMLSHAEIRKRPGADAALLHPDSFFSALLRHALGEDPWHGAAAQERIFGDMVELYRTYGEESLSGPGSSLARTEHLRERLPLLLEALGVRSLLDAPCGDFHWMRRLALGLDAYVGVDILHEVVADDQRRYGDARRRFARLDATRDELPRADAVLSRDFLPHLSYDDAFRALRNFRRTGARLLVTTTFTEGRSNVDTAGGSWRPLDLTRAPFGFPQPLHVVPERCTEAGGAFRDKALGVWALQELGL